MAKRAKRKRGRGKKNYEGVEDGMVWKPEPYPFDTIFAIIISVSMLLIGFFRNLRKVRVHK